MSKVTVVGAGNVGTTCANLLAMREAAGELVLIDIRDGLAEGKVLDIFQAATLTDFDVDMLGVTSEWEKTAGSDVVIITSGVPRRPGMSREELIDVNAGIIRSVVGEIVRYSPGATLLIVTNPVDTMTYLAYRCSGLPKSRIFGMGGALDGARFKYYLGRALDANPNEIDGMVIGGHGDATMVPLLSRAAYRGVPVSELASAEVLGQAVADTIAGGATLIGLLGTSAWYAPGAAAAMIVESLLHDRKRVIPSCVALDGEYGLNDICIGVPAVIGREGVEKIVDIELSGDELAAFGRSAEAIRSTNGILKKLGML